MTADNLWVNTQNKIKCESTKTHIQQSEGMKSKLPLRTLAKTLKHASAPKMRGPLCAAAYSSNKIMKI